MDENFPQEIPGLAWRSSEEQPGIFRLIIEFQGKFLEGEVEVKLPTTYSTNCFRLVGSERWLTCSGHPVKELQCRSDKHQEWIPPAAVILLAVGGPQNGLTSWSQVWRSAGRLNFLNASVGLFG